MVGWLVGWLIGRLDGWSVGWLGMSAGGSRPKPERALAPPTAAASLTLPARAHKRERERVDATHTTNPSANARRTCASMLAIQSRFAAALCAQKIERWPAPAAP